MAGYQRRRCAGSRNRKVPDRSNTRTPRATRAGPSWAATGSGTVRNTASVSVANWSTDKAVIGPSQTRASAGSVRASVAPEAIAVVTSTAECRAANLISSCPAYPVAPATPMRIMSPMNIYTNFRLFIHPFEDQSQSQRRVSYRGSGGSA